jgi:hypothetical protein
MSDKLYVVRLFRYDDDFTLAVETTDAEDAARKACESWYRHSHWSALPSIIQCEVRLNDDDAPWSRIDVEVSWYPEFYAVYTHGTR